MQKARIHLALLIMLSLFSSCGNKKAFVANKDKKHSSPRIEHPLLIVETGNADKDTSNSENLGSAYNQELYKLIEEWKGTPHKMGGNSKAGVDCSGLVCIIYDEVYANSFKYRRASDIFTEVDKVEKEDLKEGDLVFFKIYNKEIDHVGIYLKDGDFIHASYSRGVMISNLKEEYYQKRFYKGGRKQG